MHVREVLDREAATPLALALKAEPDWNRFLLDDEGDYEGPINAWASHWVEINIHVINGEAISWLKFGNCAALAWEIHVLTGLPLAVVMIEPDEIVGQNWAHVAVKTPEGLYLDIEGLHSEDELLGEWSRTIELKHFDPSSDDDYSEFSEICAPKFNDFRKGADEHYDAVERELIRDFARILVSDHSL